MKSCSRHVLVMHLEHGKSPFFLGCVFLKDVNVDEIVLVFDVVHGRVFLKRAF